MKTIRNLVALLIVAVSSMFAQPAEWKNVEGIFGRTGAVQNGILKIGFPRTDLTVKVGDVTVDPMLALGSWAAFQKMGEHAMTMGDLVLLETEVGPVMNRLVEGGFEISALHNHIINENPKVMYMHFMGHGNAEDLAGTLKAALELSGTPMTQPQASQSVAEPDWSSVESVLGKKGARHGSVIQFGIPRKETIKDNGMTVPPYMGMAISINMQMIGDKAATTGDFVLIAKEVNPVLRELTQHGIAVTAIHSHMLTETPRLFFMHFWGVDAPAKLAEGLKAALEKVNVSK